MGYLHIKDFKGGLDTRRMALHTPDGALVRLENAHITRGGEIEKRRAFVPLYSLPPGTHGLAAADDFQVFVFGSIANPGVPPGVTYVQLVPASGANMVRVLDQDTFTRKLYVAAEFDDGKVYHFYDGVEVTEHPTEFAFGRAVMPFDNKMYHVSGSILAYSTIGDPSDWIDAGGGDPPGAGFTDLDAYSTGVQEAIGLVPYRGLLAVFAKSTVQVWSVNDDPSLNVRTQSLDHIGTNSPHAVVEYGGSDVFFLHKSGVRSLRARDSSNSAYVTDIGTAVDTLVQAQLTRSSPVTIERARSVVEERDGRVLVAIGDTIFVFSFFPEAKVSAWSIYRPGFVVDHMETYDERVYVRSGNNIYLLGGQECDAYDDAEVIVRTPWLSGDQPATNKVFHGFDCGAENIWDVAISFDYQRGIDDTQCPLDPVFFNREGFIDLCTVDGPTYSLGDIDGFGHGTHMALELVCKRDGPARLGSIALHFDPAEAG